MKQKYNAYYRSCLTSEEKKEFKELALKRGSVMSVHDSLLREFIRSEKEKEVKNGTAVTRA